MTLIRHIVGKRWQAPSIPKQRYDSVTSDRTADILPLLRAEKMRRRLADQDETNQWRYAPRAVGETT